MSLQISYEMTPDVMQIIIEQKIPTSYTRGDRVFMLPLDASYLEYVRSRT